MHWHTLPVNDAAGPASADIRRALNEIRRLTLRRKLVLGVTFVSIPHWLEAYDDRSYYKRVSSFVDWWAYGLSRKAVHPLAHPDYYNLMSWCTDPKQPPERPEVRVPGTVTGEFSHVQLAEYAIRRLQLDR
jgi:hypothetical protein